MASTKNANGKRPLEAQQETGSKKFTFDFGAIVRIGVDLPPTYFTVHVSRLRDKSNFFKRLWAKTDFSTTSVISLYQPEILAKTFHIYLKMLYEPTTSLANLVEDTNEEYEDTWQDDTIVERCVDIGVELVRLWSLAKYLEDSSCRNAVIDTLIREDSWQVIPTYTYICKSVYDTPKDSGLRKWLVRSILQSLNRDNFDELIDSMPIQMARDVLRAYFDLKGPVGEANRLKETDAAAFYE